MTSTFSTRPTLRGRPTRWGRLARSGVAVLVGALCAGTAPAQDEDFDQGVEHLLAQRYDQALDAFKAVLAENPSNDDALAYLERGGRESFFLMLEKGGEFEATAKAFLELARVARTEKTNDSDAIDPLVDQAMEGSYLEQREALAGLAANHGEYGAAPFVAFLGSESDLDTRTRAMTCLSAMGAHSVLPLLAALQSDDDRMVWNASACLGRTDERAVPGLKAVYETSTSESARSAADDAIAKLTGQPASAHPAASALHIEMAERYFNADDRIVRPFDTSDAVWDLVDGDVRAEQVPAVLRSLRLAEQHCFAALGEARAQQILFATYAAQKAAVRGAASMEDVDVDSDMAEALMTRVDVALGAGGPSGLSNAMAFALDQDSPQAAVVLIEALAQMGDRTAELKTALGASTKMVRYAAAFALAENGHADSDVIPVLVSALGEDALRTVLVVDDEPQSRNLIADALSEAGYAVLTADSGGLGFARARVAPPKDAIIVRANMSDVTLSQFVYDQDFRTSASPMVVLTDEESRDELETQYEGKGKIAAFMTAPLAPESVVETVGAAMGDLNEERALALAASERAASILAHLGGEQLAAASEGLMAALDRSEDSVVGPVLGAVETLGPATAQAKVVSIFQSDRDDEIRVAAADALGGIFSQLGTEPAEDILGPLMEAALSDASADIRAAASRALGSATLTAERRAEFLRSQRFSGNE